jgi:cupin 2 domain-containing protein
MSTGSTPTIWRPKVGCCRLQSARPPDVEYLHIHSWTSRGYTDLDVMMPSTVWHQASHLTSYGDRMRTRGRLLAGSAAPVTGEHVETLVQMSGAVIEQILSGEVLVPVQYDQDHDEWVVVLEGAAELDVNGERLSLEPGDWVLLPRRTPHRLIHTEQGTNWLAVHLAGQ